MLQNADYKPVLSVSIPPDQRQLFYTSLAQFRQHYPFATNSGLVVQAVIAATQMEQRLAELLMQLPQAVQITQQGPTYLWRCAKGQGSASTFLEATQQALTALLRGMPSPGEEQVAAPGGTQGQANAIEQDGTA